MRFSNPPVILVSCALLLAGSIAGAAATDSSERAVWAPKEVHFTFHGFTTRYSCQGLRDKVRKALLELGARKDLQVEEGACTSPAGGPEPFPNVIVKMNVLQPLPAGTEDKSARPVLAKWKHIDLTLDKDPLWQAEDCELLEQIEHTFLPLFSTRSVDYHSTCAAHQVFPGGTWLRADVLTLDQYASNAVTAK